MQKSVLDPLDAAVTTTVTATVKKEAVAADLDVHQNPPPSVYALHSPQPS